jgi:hypothetical protein
MTVPFPNCRSICESAASSAFSLFGSMPYSFVSLSGIAIESRYLITLPRHARGFAPTDSAIQSTVYIFSFFDEECNPV